MLRLTAGVAGAAAPPAAALALALGRPRARRSFKPDVDSLPADVADGRMLLGVITGASIVPISFKCAAF